MWARRARSRWNAGAPTGASANPASPGCSARSSATGRAKTSRSAERSSFPNEQHHASEVARNDVLDAEIVIIGAGFSGLGMGIRLKQRGHDSFVILEQGAEVGGTWRDNAYPG
ncbi:MAG: NAD(P)-binding protein, partial [Candidatus Eremiobacteraeota bacterium]|nr:NAD(P)-binding protein [Candidatus Eremiobacteraeota bacterium]